MEIVDYTQRTEADALYLLYVVTKKCLELNEKVENGTRSSMMNYIHNMKAIQQGRETLYGRPDKFPEPFRSLLAEKFTELEQILSKSYLTPAPAPSSGRILRSGKVC